MFDDGVLFFPLTPFDADGAVAVDVLDRHLLDGLAHRPAGVFAGCGTGEVHALSPDEQAIVADRAVRTVGGRVPVIVGAGGPLPVAIAMCATAASSGADGVLLLPPYLVAAPQAGLIEYIAAVAAASPVPVIVYSRSNATLTAESALAVARLDNVVGLKDGVGDIDLMHRIVLTVRAAGLDDFTFFNGLPTAELTMPAYRGIGVARYSSAVFAFAPEIATAFWTSTFSGDGRLADVLLTEFYHPFVRLRDEIPGYAVSLVKAGARLRGLDTGRVRPPLVEPSRKHEARLDALLRHGLDLVAGTEQPTEHT